MEIRWFVKRNPVTAAEVCEYAECHSVSKMDAKRLLKKETKPVLQWRHGMGCDWTDVPVEVVPHPDFTPTPKADQGSR